MTYHSSLLTILLLCMSVSAGCSSSPPPPEGFSYDPPGSTVTTDKPIVHPERRTDWLSGNGIGISTAFDGARVVDAELIGDSVVHIHIAPENAPINNSAWFAFSIWAETPREIDLYLQYEAGDHRYVPKTSRDGYRWEPLADEAFVPDTADGTALLRLDIGPDTLWVAGQELLTSRVVETWIAHLATEPFVERGVVGRSRQGRPIHKLQIGGGEDPDGHVIVLGRQHPPEVSGQIALFAFTEALADDTPLARAFRERFKAIVVPLANPDGVDAGHWRHNAGGVDLNRDWQAFNQPETRALRDEFLKLKAADERVYFAVDFHSTQEDVFYTLAKDLPTTPAGFTDLWLERIAARVPGYEVNEEPFPLGSPISKNWFYEQFGAPAVTYEVGDEVERTLIRQVAGESARAMMSLLLELVPEG